MSDRLSAGKGRLSRTVEVLRKVKSLVRKADSLYMYYAWLEATTISIVTLATFYGAGMLLSFGTTTITQQIFWPWRCTTCCTRSSPRSPALSRNIGCICSTGKSAT
jgi:hypothetical protein